jgi:hypothetical protein
LQLYADGGYQLRIRRLEGTPNYGPRQPSARKRELEKRKTRTRGCVKLRHEREPTHG